MLLALVVMLAASTPESAPASAPASAAAAAPAPQPAAEAKAKAKSDLICKTEQVTGSMFPKKVCYSKAEAEARRADEQQRLRQSQTGPLVIRK